MEGRGQNMPPNAESSHVHERGTLRQRQYSYPTSQIPSYLTPATFPADNMVARPLSSHRSESPDDEDDDEDESGSQSASGTPVPPELGGEGASPAGASSIPHGTQGRAGTTTTSEGASHPPVHHLYTFPPPAPPMYPHSGMREWREVEETHLSWSSREQRPTMDMRRSGDEGYDVGYDPSVASRVHEHSSSSRYEALPTLQPQPRYHPDTRPASFHEFAASSQYEDEALAGPSSQRGYDDPHHLRPPPYYPDSHYGRHHPPTMYGAGEGSRSTSSSSFAPVGTLQDSGPSSSRVVLPPVSQLLGTLGSMAHDHYEQGPVLPRLRLLDEPEEAEAGVSGLAESTRGKKRRTEATTGESEERKSKVGQKIYVACDFCRGRKLRCDGTKPRCSNCATRSLACRYQEHPRRRGPGKAPKGSRKTGRGRKKGGGDTASAETGGPSTRGEAGEEPGMAWTPPPEPGAWWAGETEPGPDGGWRGGGRGG